MVFFDNLLYTSPERASVNLMTIRKQLRMCADDRAAEMTGMVNEIDDLVSKAHTTCMGFSYRSANISEDIRKGRYDCAAEALRRLYAAQENVARSQPVPALEPRFARF